MSIRHLSLSSHVLYNGYLYVRNLSPLVQIVHVVDFLCSSLSFSLYSSLYDIFHDVAFLASSAFAFSGRIDVAPDRNLINPRRVLVDFTDPTIYPATTPPPVVGPKRLSDSSTTALIVTPILVVAGLVVGGVTHCYYNERCA